MRLHAARGRRIRYWSVLVSSAPTARTRRSRSNRSRIISQGKTTRNQSNRFEARSVRSALTGATTGCQAQHEAFSIPRAGRQGMKKVHVIAPITSGRQKFCATANTSQLRRCVEIEAAGRPPSAAGDSVLLCEEHATSAHTCRAISRTRSRWMIVYDPRSNRLETVTELSILADQGFEPVGSTYSAPTRSAGRITR